MLTNKEKRTLNRSINGYGYYELENYEYSDWRLLELPNHSFIISSRYIGYDQRFLVDLLQYIDEDKYRLTNDCEITKLIFSRISSEEKKMKYYGKNIKRVKHAINSLREIGYEYGYNYLISMVSKGKSYINLFKILEIVGFSKTEINAFITNNIHVLEYNFTNISSKEEIGYAVKMLKGKNVKEIIEVLNNYAKIKRVLDVLSISEERKYEIAKKHIEENKQINEEKIEEAISNMNFLLSAALIEKVDIDSFCENVIKNFNIILSSSNKKIVSTIAMLNTVGLDYQVLHSELEVINKFEEELPVKLYRYAETLKNMKTSIRTVDQIDILIDNFNYDVLKRKYPLILEDKTNVIMKIINDYKKYYNRGIRKINMQRKMKEGVLDEEI